MSFSINVEAISVNPHLEQVGSNDMPKKIHLGFLHIMNYRNISDLLALPWRQRYIDMHVCVCVCSQPSGKTSIYVR